MRFFKSNNRSNLRKWTYESCLLTLILAYQLGQILALPAKDRSNKYDLMQQELGSAGNMPLSPFSPNIGKSSPLMAATYYFNPPRRQASREESTSEAEIFEDGCRAADGREGTCYDAMRCIDLDGVPMGRCGAQNSVCCIFERTCGSSSTQQVTYFRNPNYPSPYDKEEMCKLRVERRDTNVCQIRLDFINFDLSRPKDGNCSQDMLVVSGQNENNLVPKICGANSGQHYYIDVDEGGMVSLHVMMVANYPRTFDIKITQISCNTPQSAPAHCLQYFVGTSGYIKSFNYDAADSDGQGYPNDMDYTICLRKEPGFCSVSYELATTSTGAVPFGVGALPSGSVISGPVLAECPDDYLVIGGVRVCSGKLNSSSIPTRVNSRVGNSTLIATYSQPTGLISDTTSGPFFVRFVSNMYNNARGFYLLYRQNPCK